MISKLIFDQKVRIVEWILIFTRIHWEFVVNYKVKYMFSFHYINGGNIYYKMKHLHFKSAFCRSSTSSCNSTIKCFFFLLLFWLKTFLWNLKEQSLINIPSTIYIKKEFFNINFFCCMHLKVICGASYLIFSKMNRYVTNHLWCLSSLHSVSILMNVIICQIC